MPTHSATSKRKHPTRRKTYVCSECGSPDVTQDALACWDVDSQEWEIVTLLDCADCNVCGGETHLVEKPV